MSQATQPFLTGPSATLGDSGTPLVLRVKGGRRDGHIVSLTEPKCTVGSSPGCSLQLVVPGVQSVHCLIVRGRNGVAIRRWSSDTFLNDELFADAELFSGDRLSVGPVQLQVLDGPSSGRTPSSGGTDATSHHAIGSASAAPGNGACEAPRLSSLDAGSSPAAARATPREPRQSGPRPDAAGYRGDEGRGTLLCFVGIVALMIGATLAARLTEPWTWPTLFTGLTLASAVACVTRGLRIVLRPNTPQQSAS